MLKAGALLYAVILSFLIALISVFFILNAYFQNRIVENQIQYEQLKSNTNASITSFLNGCNFVDIGSEKQFQVFNDVESNAILKHFSWGLYSYISASAKWKHLKYEKKALVGDVSGKDKTALYLADHNNYLSICGNNIIKGNASIPKLGPKRAYIEGKSYSGEKLIEGKISISDVDLPVVKEDIINQNIKYLDRLYSNKDSIGDFALFSELDSISNPFSSKTLIFEVPNNTAIENKILIGNIILISQGDLTIENNNYFEDIVLYAKSIFVESGFESNVQFIARHNVTLEKHVKLYYPSSVCLIKNNDFKASQILMEEHSLVEGSVLLLNKRKNPKDKAILKIEKNAIVHGLAYSNDLVEHKGIVKGSLYANQFILRTASSIYENHLLDATIDYSQLSPYFVGIDIFGQNLEDKKKVIKWLN